MGGLESLDAFGGLRGASNRTRGILGVVLTRWFLWFSHDFIQVPRCDCCSGLPEGFVWLLRTLDEFL